MNKYYILLLVMASVLTSCEPDAQTMPMSHVPTGILFLATIGVVATILFLVGLIVIMGGILEGDRD